MLVNEISNDTISKTKNSFLNDLATEDVNIKKNYEIDAEIKKEILEEIYNFFKKKIRRNTLKKEKKYVYDLSMVLQDLLLMFAFPD